eukprot:3228180-Lingulodinium_polyedra.AAC.1
MISITGETAMANLATSSPASDALADAEESGAGAAKTQTGSSDDPDMPNDPEIDDIPAIRLIT